VRGARHSAKREGQAGFAPAPNAQIEHSVQPHLGEEELPFMNEEASRDHLFCTASMICRRA